ncbi:MAG: hypothetical protein ACREK8_11260 [Gemmatimonadales bacterium]
MPCGSRRGESLVELIVALVLLELAGSLALATALTAEHLARHAAAVSSTDASRWQEYRSRELLPGCLAALAPDTVPLWFPPTSDRPGLATTVRCGH